MSTSRMAFVIDEPFIPDVYGGGVADIHELSRAMPAYGWKSEVHCLKALSPLMATRAVRGLIRRLPLPIAPTKHDSHLGYPVHRRSVLSLTRQIQLPGLGADVVVLQGARIPELATRYAGRGIPVIMRVVTTASVDEIEAYMRGNGSFHDHLRSGAVLIVANSQFVATVAEEKLAVRVAWNYPPIAPSERPGEVESRGKSILFVNPVQLKGVETALQVAELMPERKFIFQQSWPLERSERAFLEGRLARLPNVELRANATSLDAVFLETALLLVPSVVDEAFGRVIVEAHRFGVPVVASRVGGIPEAVRSGGILLERDAPAQNWVSAIETIMSADGAWTDSAFSNGQSAEFSLDHVLASFVALMEALRAKA